jgi:hypothetical protein
MVYFKNQPEQTSLGAPSGFGEDSVSYEEYLLCEMKKLRGWSFGVRGSPQDTYLVIVEPREVPQLLVCFKFANN